MRERTWITGARGLFRTFDRAKQKIWSCCSQPLGSTGCDIGVHVFYENEVADLHARHAFSYTESSSASVLDVVALDCEMIYTTGGMRVARVSIVDGDGKEVFDELVRMDEGVSVLCVSNFGPVSDPKLTCISEISTHAFRGSPV